MMRHRRRYALAAHDGPRGALLAVALALGAFAISAEARADACVPGFSSPNAVAGEAKRALGEQHLAAAKAQATDQATRARELAEAERQFRAAVEATECVIPLNVLRLAQTLELEGHHIAAIRSFEQITALRDKLGKYRIYADPLARATQGAAEARTRLAELEVVVLAPNCEEPIVKLDGEPVASGAQQHDPGVLQIDASARGCDAQSMRYLLREGAHKRVEIVLQRSGPSPPPPPRPPPPSRCHDLFCPRWLWLSIGGAALAAGGGYVGYRALSHGSSGGEVPSGSLDRVQLP